MLAGTTAAAAPARGRCSLSAWRAGAGWSCSYVHDAAPGEYDGHQAK